MLVVWCLLSCAGSGPCERGPIEIEIGDGLTDFVPLAAGDEVTMVFGPQGGWHVDVAARVTGATADVEVRPTVRRVTDGLQLAGEQAASLLLLAGHDEETCTGDALGVRAFLDDAAPSLPYPDFICSLDGSPLEVSVEVSDFAGRSGDASLEVIARTDPNQDCG